MAPLSFRDRLRLGGRALRALGLTCDELARLEVNRLRCETAQYAALQHRHRSKWAERMMKMLRLEVRTSGEGIDDERLVGGTDARGVGRVFVFNHRSALDVLIAVRYFEGVAVSRADVADWPLVGRCARRVGTLFVERGNAASGAAVVAAMARSLESGQGIVIFPEGTVFPGDEVRPLKSGAFRAAQQAGAEIVPVGLCYADAGTTYGEEGFLAHSARVAAIPRTVAAVAVGASVPSEGSLDELRTHVRGALQRSVTAARATLSSRP